MVGTLRFAHRTACVLQHIMRKSRPSSSRTRGPIRRALSFWARRPRPSVLTNAGGYGSLLSQGRRKRIRLSNNRYHFAPRGAMRPSCAFISRPLEGVGNAGCPLHPQPRVQCVGSTRVVTTVAPGSPGIPARNGFNGLLRALPGDRACLPPSSADIGCLSSVEPTCLRELDASVGASGPHDFAVRSNRLSSAHSVIAHRSFDPPCHHLARKTLPRPSHPVPYVRDDRDTPLLWDGMAESINLFLPNGEAEYFCKEGWTAESTNCPSGKSPDRAVQPAARQFQVFSSASSTFMMPRLKSAKVGAAGTRPLCVQSRGPA